MRADGERMKEVRESHRGMVDGCRWRGGGMGDRAASASAWGRDSAWGLTKLSSDSQIRWRPDEVIRSNPGGSVY